MATTPDTIYREGSNRSRIVQLTGVLDHRVDRIGRALSRLETLCSGCTYNPAITIGALGFLCEMLEEVDLYLHREEQSLEQWVHSLTD